MVYVPSDPNDKVYVIDTSSNTVTSSISVSGGATGVAISADGSKLYVSNGANNTVSAFNTSDNSAIGSPISVGTYPRGIAFTPDGSYAYVANMT